MSANPPPDSPVAGTIDAGGMVITYIAVGLGTVFLFFFCFCCVLPRMTASNCPRLGDPEFDAAVEHGKAIAAALETFQAEHQAYPTTLDRLVPKYLPKLPKPSWGEGWTYLLDSAGKPILHLYCDSGDSEILYKNGEWQFSDSW